MKNPREVTIHNIPWGSASVYGSMFSTLLGRLETRIVKQDGGKRDSFGEGKAIILQYYDRNC